MKYTAPQQYCLWVHLDISELPLGPCLQPRCLCLQWPWWRGWGWVQWVAGKGQEDMMQRWGHGMRRGRKRKREKWTWRYVQTKFCFLLNRLKPDIVCSLPQMLCKTIYSCAAAANSVCGFCLNCASLVFKFGGGEKCPSTQAMVVGKSCLFLALFELNLVWQRCATEENISNPGWFLTTIFFTKPTLRINNWMCTK